MQSKVSKPWPNVLHGPSCEHVQLELSVCLGERGGRGGGGVSKGAIMPASVAAARFLPASPCDPSSLAINIDDQ